MKNRIDYSLYLVTDRDILGKRDICTAVEEAILGGVTIVQLREKHISSLDFYEIALKVKAVTDKYNIPLLINDRLDVALAVDAAGVHLGQSDFPCEVARRLIGRDKILGFSVSTLEEAMEAEQSGADYLGVGAMFPTSTKLDACTVKLKTLEEIKKAVNIPIVAIGGINEQNYTALEPSDIDGIAIISAILGKEDIRGAASCFKLKLK